MNFITNFLTIQNQLRVYHWQTQKKVGSFAQHEAFGKAYLELDEQIDDFIEIYQGKRGVIMGNDGFNLKLYNLDSNPMEFMDEVIEYLSLHVKESLDPEADTDLLNIKDTMLGIINQTKYRLNLR
jgi:hypothetical protein